TRVMCTFIGGVLVPSMLRAPVITVSESATAIVGSMKRIDIVPGVYVECLNATECSVAIIASMFARPFAARPVGLTRSPSLVHVAAIALASWMFQAAANT